MPSYEVLLRKSEYRTFEKRVEVIAADWTTAMTNAVEGQGQDPTGWEETTDPRGNSDRIEVQDIEEVR